MNRDALYNILLSMHINDIYALYTDKTSVKNINNILNDTQFWKDKFDYNDLPIINKMNNVYEWVKEYQKVLHATQETNKIFNSFYKSTNTMDIILNPLYRNNMNDTIRHILPHNMNFIPYSMKYNHTNQLFYNPAIFGSNQSIAYDIDENTMREFLVKLIYYNIQLSIFIGTNTLYANNKLSIFTTK